mmetsp:Transcript_25373/g.70086  ORF Transcript_25373/g.70086 Transcript_25373/m.70086 type:complete len:116 (+) Transcript_25373:1756-2103(+)
MLVWLLQFSQNNTSQSGQPLIWVVLRRGAHFSAGQQSAEVIHIRVGNDQSRVLGTVMTLKIPWKMTRWRPGFEPYLALLGSLSAMESKEPWLTAEPLSLTGVLLSLRSVLVVLAS